MIKDKKGLYNMFFKKRYENERRKKMMRIELLEGVFSPLQYDYIT